MIDYQNEPDDTLVPRAVARRMLGNVSNDTMRRLERSGRLPPRYLSANLPSSRGVYYRLGDIRALQRSGVLGPREPPSPSAPPRPWAGT